MKSSLSINVIRSPLDSLIPLFLATLTPELFSSIIRILLSFLEYSFTFFKVLSDDPSSINNISTFLYF